MAGAVVVRAGGQAANSGQVKAAFILNFLDFTEWPDANRGPRIIGVIGDAPLAAALSEAVRGSARERAVIRRLERVEDADGVAVLFIGTAERDRLPAILRRIDSRPVLTVGDTPGFAEAGVMLNFYTFDQRVRIEVNTAAVARAQLKLSAQLLRLVRIVG